MISGGASDMRSHDRGPRFGTRERKGEARNPKSDVSSHEVDAARAVTTDGGNTAPDVSPNEAKVAADVFPSGSRRRSGIN